MRLKVIVLGITGIEILVFKYCLSYGSEQSIIQEPLGLPKI